MPGLADIPFVHRQSGYAKGPWGLLVPCSIRPKSIKLVDGKVLCAYCNGEMIRVGE